jgi:hypothetical protein
MCSLHIINHMTQCCVGKSFTHRLQAHMAIVQCLNHRFYLCNFSLIVRNLNIKTIIFALSQLGLVRVIGFLDCEKGRGFDSRWCHWNFSLT